MAKKIIDLTNLTKYNEQIAAKYATKTALQAVQDAVDAIEVPTKVSDLTNDSGFQTAADVTTAIADKADKATTLSGYGIADAYTKTEVNSKLSSVYKAGGSFAFASVPAAGEGTLGYVYNVTDDFTTTAAFVEGAGNDHPAGTNVVVVEIPAADDGDPTYAYDVLAGSFDLSGYVEVEAGKGLSTNDYTTAEKTKLAGIAEGATKVEASETNGNIKIDGTETTVYTLPSNVLTSDDFEDVTEAEILALFA